MLNNNICTYGLFRQGQCYNTHVRGRFGEDSIEYIRTVNIPGYIMYDCIFNSSIEKTCNEKDIIVADLIRVNDEVYQFIKEMDTGGKFFEDIISIDDVNYSIFVEHDIDKNHKTTLVESGDWSNV